MRYYLGINIAGMIMLLITGFYLFTNLSSINMLALVLLIGLLSVILYTLKLRSLLISFTSGLGVICIVGSVSLVIYYSTNLTDAIVREAIRAYYIGIMIMAISVILSNKPKLFYAKNRPTDLNIAIWNSNNTKDLIPLKMLLSIEELYMLPNYNYILVLIDDNIYLVKPDDLIPAYSKILRSKGYFLGIRKA